MSQHEDMPALAVSVLSVCVRVCVCVCVCVCVKVCVCFWVRCGSGSGCGYGYGWLCGACLNYDPVCRAPRAALQTTMMPSKALPSANLKSCSAHSLLRRRSAGLHAKKTKKTSVQYKTTGTCVIVWRGARNDSFRFTSCRVCVCVCECVCCLHPAWST